MNSFLKYVPGYRSDKTWKKIIASMYYVFILLYMFVEPRIALFLLSIPFFIFSIINFFKAIKNTVLHKTTIITLAIALVISLIGLVTIGFDKTNVVEKQEFTIVEENKLEETNKAEKKPGKLNELKEKDIKDLKVHYIDVDQGDSIFIQLPNGQTMLIDGGPKKNAQIVVDYLKKQKIKKIDYIVATHPHEDHIGGLPKIINTFSIGDVYMSDVVHTTKTFEDLLLAIKNKDKKIKTAKSGDVLIDEKKLNVSVLAPKEGLNDSNLNNYSVVIKLKYKDNSFLFTGDAEIESENIVINNGYDLKSNVLKVGHHGSNTATSNEFLNKVNPEYAIISCGQNNRYGHPHQTTVDKLKAKNVEIYRTDIGGTIVVVSNGEKIIVEKEKINQQNNVIKSESKVNSTSSLSLINDNEEVYIVQTGKKYHKSNCKCLKENKIPISLQKAKAQGHTPCKVCNP